ncbi:hypothetical protein Plhal304r1_c011g0042991 [Plasmopara halstedii]
MPCERPQSSRERCRLIHTSQSDKYEENRRRALSLENPNQRWRSTRTSILLWLYFWLCSEGYFRCRCTHQEFKFRMPLIEDSIPQFLCYSLS